MEKLTPKLKEFKEEFDLLHRQIGKLEWEICTAHYGRRAVLRSELDQLYERLENYQSNKTLLLEQVREAVSDANSRAK